MVEAEKSGEKAKVGREGHQRGAVAAARPGEDAGSGDERTEIE